MHPQFNNEIFEKVDIEKLKEFVFSRQNDDGGFAFCKPLPSSLSETYYAVYILKSIGAEIPERDKLLEFLKSNVREEIYSVYYTFNTLYLLGEEISDLGDFLLKKLRIALSRRSTKNIVGERGITATYSFELPSILRETYLIASSLKLLGMELPEDVRTFVLRKVGGFGSLQPNLEETFYCVYILGRDVVEIKDSIIAFIKRFECSGGFAKTPNSYPPYLEETYYALSCFKLLGYKYRNERTIEYIASLQNPNGGFRRSIHGGISTLENTYYAVASLGYFTY